MASRFGCFETITRHLIFTLSEFAAQISIRNPSIIYGKLPPRILGYVIEWAAIHEAELTRCWQAAQTDQVIGKIEPLV